MNKLIIMSVLLLGILYPHIGLGSDLENKFKEGLNTYYAKRCSLLFTPAREYPVQVELYPLDMIDDLVMKESLTEKNRINTSKYEALVKVGLLNVSVSSRTTSKQLFPEQTVNFNIPVNNYSLTKKGNLTFQSSGRQYANGDELMGFCMYVFEVIKISSSTKPAPFKKKGKVAFVSYSMKASKIANWVLNPIIQKEYQYDVPNSDNLNQVIDVEDKQIFLFNDNSWRPRR